MSMFSVGKLRRDIVEKQYELKHFEIDPDNHIEAYNEMLDECYDLSKVGGPFEHMSASYVLKECDETAYRCGLNDYVNGLDKEDDLEYQKLAEELEALELETEERLI